MEAFVVLDGPYGKGPGKNLPVFALVVIAGCGDVEDVLRTLEQGLDFRDVDAAYDQPFRQTVDVMAGRKGIVEFFDGRPQGMVLSLVLLLVRFFQDFLFEEGPFPGAEGEETGTDSLPRRLGQGGESQG